MLALPPVLAAEQSIIRMPGEHPTYAFEAEPHLLLGFEGPFRSGGSAALGFRGTFHIADGFVSTINDTVGVGAGVDFAGNDRVLVPVVLQWNFWLSTHWSVFGEPGVAIASGSNAVLPLILSLGGRYHFTDKISLTMRIGYPAASVGVSFFL